jgi:hypothetical protein
LGRPETGPTTQLAPEAEARAPMVPAAAITVAEWEAFHVVGRDPAQQPWQAGQLGELMAAFSTARHVRVDGNSVGGADDAKDVDPKLKTNLSARRGSGHGLQPLVGCTVSAIWPPTPATGPRLHSGGPHGRRAGLARPGSAPCDE